MESALSTSRDTYNTVQLHLEEAVTVLKCVSASLLLNLMLTAELHKTALHYLVEAGRI
ncbi:hypothetical protein [Anaplasma phagocytophilum]|uniref:hypothetical protein n=1 Tax=Anaplasma phagocytophilum TaxID=948 RepID=UPI00201AB5B9